MKLPGTRLWIVGLLALVGCKQSPYPTAPVRGTVTIDGQPMRQGKVMFAPVAQDGLNSGRPAFGHIQPDGSFVLSTYRDGDGAVVGDHWVSIANEVSASITATRGGPVNKSNFRSITFPRQTVSVLADQENEIDIELTSREIAKYGKPFEPDR